MHEFLDRARIRGDGAQARFVVLEGSAVFHAAVARPEGIRDRGGRGLALEDDPRGRRVLDDLPRHQELARPELALFLDGVAQTIGTLGHPPPTARVAGCHSGQKRAVVTRSKTASAGPPILMVLTTVAMRPPFGNSRRSRFRLSGRPPSCLRTREQGLPSNWANVDYKRSLHRVRIFWAED